MEKKFFSQNLIPQMFVSRVTGRVDAQNVSKGHLKLNLYFNVAGCTGDTGIRWLSFS